MPVGQFNLQIYSLLGFTEERFNKWYRGSTLQRGETAAVAESCGLWEHSCNLKHVSVVSGFRKVEEEKIYTAKGQ